MQHKQADVCLILEGTYPYVMGGVSNWTHELITMQQHLTFSIVALISSDASDKLLYKLPPNVIDLQTIRLQVLKEGDKSLPLYEEKALFKQLEGPLLNLQSHAQLSDLKDIISTIAPFKGELGSKLLINSESAWNMLLHMYHVTMPKTPFLDYFWSWRGLFGGLYSILLAPLPEARSYHALCTGYAGLMLARAHIETGKPCMVTEHGIYTNERRIEIITADWLHDLSVFNLSVTRPTGHTREIKDFWIDTFVNYSRLCYESCNRIITLYKGNQEFQKLDGASPAKLKVIPNGIDASRYSILARTKNHPPTIALIGRVVSIKDIKTYIKAVSLLKESLPKLVALVIGPVDEEPDYAQECIELVEHFNLKESLVFTGKVDIEPYLKVIDVNVLTSISEAQPLVILEAGAAGIPTVATDVGACREMVKGDKSEKPYLGEGGIIVPLANPKAIADALLKLLTDKDYYNKCSTAIKKRVIRYYSKQDQYEAYANLYESLIEGRNEEIIEEHDLIKEAA